MKITRIYTCVFCMMTISSPLLAATYHISPSGDDANPGTNKTPWKTITKANSTLQPGDTALIHAGEYHETIKPARSGKPGQPITYKAYKGDTPVITNSPGGTAILLDNRSYIVIDALVLDGKKPFQNSNLKKWITMVGAHHNVIKNCNFQYAKGYWGILIANGTYNEILNNRMDYVGAWDDGTGHAVADMIGIICSNYNRLEDNHFTRSGHELLDVNGDFNVIRNNIFDNGWGDNKGYRSVSLDANRKYCSDTKGYNLFENNILRNSLVTSNGNKAPAMKIEGTNQIVRNNVFYNNLYSAFSGGARPPKIMESAKAKVYNNTLYKTGRLWNAGGPWSSTGRVEGNVFKNNIIYDYHINPFVTVNNVGDPPGTNRAPIAESEIKYNATYSRTQNQPILRFVGGSTKTLEEYQATHPNNFQGNIRIAALPKFISDNPKEHADFRLKKGSPFIDQGSFLTKTVQDGSGTRIPVEDAGYFSDGFGIISADHIQVGDNRPVQISSIDYENNIIVVEHRTRWKAGDVVSLPYKGVAPDIGAHEFGERIVTPTGFQIEVTPQSLDH